MRKIYGNDILLRSICVIGGIINKVTLWYPAYEIAKTIEPNNMVVVHKKLYYTLCFFFSLVWAPALIIAIMNSEAFIKAFVESLLDRENK